MSASESHLFYAWLERTSRTLHTWKRNGPPTTPLFVMGRNVRQYIHQTLTFNVVIGISADHNFDNNTTEARLQDVPPTDLPEKSLGRPSRGHPEFRRFLDALRAATCPARLKCLPRGRLSCRRRFRAGSFGARDLPVAPLSSCPASLVHIAGMLVACLRKR